MGRPMRHSPEPQRAFAMPTLSAADHKIGVIDLGSNSARLQIIQTGGETTLLHREKRMVRLGDGSFAEKRLQEPAMRRTLDALRLFADRCREYGTEEILAVTTSAVRDAINGGEFVGRVLGETGIRLRILSGEEEARLIYLGVASGLKRARKNRLFIDIGGGSTEHILEKEGEIALAVSVNAGCVRLANRFPSPQDGRITAREYRAMRAQVRKAAKKAFRRLGAYTVAKAVGSSGTICCLARLASLEKGKWQEAARPQPADALFTLSRKKLAKLARALRKMTLEERKALNALSAPRCEVIVAGCAILETLMKKFGLKKITASQRGLEEGVVEEWLKNRKNSSAKTHF